MGLCVPRPCMWDFIRCVSVLFISIVNQFFGEVLSSEIEEIPEKKKGCASIIARVLTLTFVFCFF